MRHRNFMAGERSFSRVNSRHSPSAWGFVSSCCHLNYTVSPPPVRPSHLPRHPEEDDGAFDWVEWRMYRRGGGGRVAVRPTKLQ